MIRTGFLRWAAAVLVATTAMFYIVSIKREMRSYGDSLRHAYQNNTAWNREALRRLEQMETHINKLAHSSRRVRGATLACPAAWGTLTTARDTHSLCVMCLGLKHAQEAIHSPESCSHCLALPKKLKRWRQRVAATHGNDLGPKDSHTGRGDVG
ncbi:hypothetical protein SKAU_G00025590 [Synaphobranchus kaupii]|uniref:Uncharacterized protein n=1 Tax=Synaphobranchus kaupii TaxID=118154 RepID=A0A9Q1GCM4_SYNKA|nr:hypothetical protein SKAU_G00025590 [Synaphobranchus kaupii]